MGSRSQNATQLSPAELIEGAASLGRRLSRHLDAWDAGDADAMFDVAAVARTLLASGKGDKAIRRLCSQEGLAEPTILVPNPVPTDESVLFGFGGFPVDSVASNEGCNEMTISAWLKSPFFRKAMTDQAYRQVSWERLVVEYGNAYGAHLGVAHPTEIEQARLFSGHARKLTEQGLWVAAVAAENALAELLPQVGVHTRSPRQLQSPAATLLAVIFHREGDEIWQEFPFIMGPQISEGEVKLLHMPVMGKELDVAIRTYRDGNGALKTVAEGYVR